MWEIVTLFYHPNMQVDLVEEEVRGLWMERFTMTMAVMELPVFFFL